MSQSNETLTEKKYFYFQVLSHFKYQIHSSIYMITNIVCAVGGENNGNIRSLFMRKIYDVFMKYL